MTRQPIATSTPVDPAPRPAPCRGGADGRAEWVDVKKGVTEGDLVDVIGDLKPGDIVVPRANDEIREGSPLQATAK